MSKDQQNQIDWSKLRYVVLPGKYLLSGSPTPLYNQAYHYWKSFWSHVYTQAGSPESFLKDDFLRQDLVALLVYENSIVGMHLYSLFSLEKEATRDHSYLEFYPPEFYQFMESHQSDYVMSFEFLTVDPGWRKSVAGVSMAEVLIGCGVKWAQSLKVDAVIAPARTENKVNTMAYSFGAECFQAGVLRRNIKVDLIVAFQENLTENANPQVNQLATALWNRCENHSLYQQSLMTSKRSKNEAA